MEIQRSETGINGLDSLLQGGIPKNSTVLVTGSPGTGKTLFCLQFLIKGCESNESSLLLSFEEKEEDIIKQASQFGWDLKAYIDTKKLFVKSIDVMTSEDIFKDLTEFVKTNNITRLVVDSLTAFQSYPLMVKQIERFSF